jgi:hypothetical protein
VIEVRKNNPVPTFKQIFERIPTDLTSRIGNLPRIGRPLILRLELQRPALKLCASCKPLHQEFFSRRCTSFVFILENCSNDRALPILFLDVFEPTRFQIRFPWECPSPYVLKRIGSQTGMKRDCVSKRECENVDLTEGVIRAVHQTANPLLAISIHAN